MKKIFILTVMFGIALFFALVQDCSAKVRWKELKSGDIYIKPFSTKIVNGTATAWFKVNASKNNGYYEYKNVAVSYDVTRWKAYCNSGLLDMIRIASFSYEDKLLRNQLDYQSFPVNYREYRDGEIYYNALCGKRKNIKTNKMPIEEFVYIDDENRMEELYLDKKGNVAYKGRTIMKNKKEPLNIKTASRKIERTLLSYASKVSKKQDE